MKYLILLFILVSTPALADETDNPYGPPDNIPQGVPTGDCAICAVDAIQQDPTVNTDNSSDSQQNSSAY